MTPKIIQSIFYELESSRTPKITTITNPANSIPPATFNIRCQSIPQLYAVPDFLSRDNSKAKSPISGASRLEVPLLENSHLTKVSFHNKCQDHSFGKLILAPRFFNASRVINRSEAVVGIAPTVRTEAMVPENECQFVAFANSATPPKEIKPFHRTTSNADRPLKRFLRPDPVTRLYPSAFSLAISQSVSSDYQ
jgi:hypothetical protein